MTTSSSASGIATTGYPVSVARQAVRASSTKISSGVD